MRISHALILSPITKGHVTSSTAPPKKLLTTSFAAKPTAIPVAPTLQAINFFIHSFTPKRHDKSRLLRVKNSTHSSSNAEMGLLEGPAIDLLNVDIVFHIEYFCVQSVFTDSPGSMIQHMLLDCR